MMNVKYSVVVPVFNEEEVISESYKRLTNVMREIGEPYEIVFVDDGSRDKTFEMIKDISKSDNAVRLVSFSRNFGHQPAVSAGINESSGEAVIVIDADLQDPPEIIPKMIKKWKAGFQVVYGKRLKRQGETFFKKLTAKMFYRFLSSMTNVKIPVDTGDFRLIDRKVCDTFSALTERNRYIRGLISWVGFSQTYVEYIRDERFAGETKYPLKKMIKFASDGIMSFSYKPLKLATYLGFIVSAASFVYMIVVIIQRLLGHAAAIGWASTIAALLLLNGITLIILGIMGSYIGRIYDEVQNRPLYIIKDKIGYDEQEKND